MSVDELVALRQEIDNELSGKVLEHRRSIESQLAKLNRFHSSSRANSFGDTRKLVAPKSRNPDNPSRTWAGRGLKPLWLKVAIDAGKTLDSFLISHSTPPLEVAERKKVGKIRK